MEAKVLLIVGVVTRTSNSSHKKTAISSSIAQVFRVGIHARCQIWEV